MQIIPNLYQINLGYVNAYLIAEDDGLTLIDAGMPFHYKQILNTIKHFGLDPTQIKCILLTHGDPDHAGCVNKLREVADFKVYASQLAADNLAFGKPSRALQLGALMNWVMARVEPMISKPVQVDEILKEGDTRPLLGGMQVIETPGHTPAHLSFYFPEHKVLIAGDSMRANKLGLIPGNIAPITWDADQLYASIAKQRDLGAETVAVGHGPVRYKVRDNHYPIPYRREV